MIQFSYDEVSRIVKASKSTVENNKKYQMFHKGFLQKIWDIQINHQILFSLAISPNDLDKIEFVDEIVDFYCTTNMLHPFREGNGRTQRLFISQLIRHNGYDFNFSDIDTDELMIATIHSANGVTDFLRDIFLKNIR